MSKILKKVRKIILGLAVVFFAVQKVTSGEPYLKSAGPPALRIAMAVTPNPFILMELKLPTPTTNAPPPMPVPPPKPADTDAQNEVPPGMMGPFPANFSPSPQNPASGMLNMTPQMIDEYFKPRRRGDGTNDSDAFQPGDTIFVPAELGFVPPMPAQSRAIYISK
jgi:hypothetical protein